MSPTPIIGQDAAVDRAAGRRNLGLWLSGAPPLRSRPAAKVERSHPIRVGLEIAPDAHEVVEISAVDFVHEPASGTCLRGVSCIDHLHVDAFLSRLVLDGEPQETVGNSVHLLPRSLSPLSPSLPQVLEPLEGYPGLELSSKLDNFRRELPAPGPRVVPLSSAESLEFLASLASVSSVSMGLELRPSLLKLRLHPHQVLSEVELSQHFAPSAEDGHRDAASVDVHPQHVGSFSFRWVVLSQDGEELEVVTHDHGADLPACFEVGLEPLPYSILSDWQTYSFRVDANAQGRVAPPRGPEAEETPVETNGDAVNTVGGFAGAPCTPAGFTDELSCDSEPLSMAVISQTVEFGAAFGPAGLDQREALPDHPEEGPVGLEQLTPLDPGQREHVQDKTFSHGYQARFAPMHSSDFRGGGSPKQVYKLFKGTSIAANRPAESVILHFFALSPPKTENYIVPPHLERWGLRVN